MTVSVLTLVRDREPHLRQLVEGLRRSVQTPDELVVVDMGGAPLAPLCAPFPIRIERLETDGLPLAAARNRAARAAMGDRLVFLDVDCIVSKRCLDRMIAALDRWDGLLCAEALYLGPDDARGSWREAELQRRGRRHPARVFPRQGVRVEPNPGLFWSLAFAVRRATFERIGGFDEDFTGYGGEDTDFGYRTTALGAPLIFVGGAQVFHQHHATYEPPVQHLDAIVANCCRFHARWGRWPMEGWLDAFAAMGLITIDGERIELKRNATADEFERARMAAERLWTPSTIAERIAPSPV